MYVDEYRDHVNHLSACVVSIINPINTVDVTRGPRLESLEARYYGVVDNGVFVVPRGIIKTKSLVNVSARTAVTRYIRYYYYCYTVFRAIGNLGKTIVGDSRRELRDGFRVFEHLGRAPPPRKRTTFVYPLNG